LGRKRGLLITTLCLPGITELGTFWGGGGGKEANWSLGGHLRSVAVIELETIP